MRPSKEQMYLDIAEVVSKRSSCGRLQVGAVLVDKDFENILAFGYNGNYRGGPNECDSTTPGACGCLHAELNCLLKPERHPDSVLFVTTSPCIGCAKAIINSHIKMVYYKDAYRDDSGLQLLAKASVITIKL